MVREQGRSAAAVSAGGGRAGRAGTLTMGSEALAATMGEGGGAGGSPLPVSPPPGGAGGDVRTARRTRGASAIGAGEDAPVATAATAGGALWDFVGRAQSTLQRVSDEVRPTCPAPVLSVRRFTRTRRAPPPQVDTSAIAFTALLEFFGEDAGGHAHTPESFFSTIAAFLRSLAVAKAEVEADEARKARAERLAAAKAAAGAPVSKSSGSGGGGASAGGGGMAAVLAAIRLRKGESAGAGAAQPAAQTAAVLEPPLETAPDSDPT